MDDDKERAAHLQLLKGSAFTEALANEEGRIHDISVAPLFSRKLRLAIKEGDLIQQGVPAVEVYPQFGLLGDRQVTYHSDGSQDRSVRPIKDQDMVYANISAPWSAFICGSQGGGKSHTLSCLLENSLLSSKAGILPKPLTGIVFHYDKFTSHASTQVCEAAYLGSRGIPVRVLVSKSNLSNMRKLYWNLPNYPSNSPKPQILPLRLREKQLNVSNMLTLMGANNTSHVPLYMATLKQILRDMAEQKQGGPGIDYQLFIRRLEEESFSRDQNALLKLRLQLLEEFLEQGTGAGTSHSAGTEDIWQFEKGTLTIVDLSCPFVNEEDACALFAVCLGLFLEHRSNCGRIIALDEAHKVFDTPKCPIIV